jgi:hypothetical protein
MAEKLKACPFCGGNGKVSFKDYRFFGQNCFGDKMIQYRVQVICNKCKSRGKPILTDRLKNPDPYRSKWGNWYHEESPWCKRETEMFQPFVERAIEAWNRRDGDSDG